MKKKNQNQIQKMKINLYQKLSEESKKYYLQKYKNAMELLR